MAFPGTYNINYYKGDTLEFRVYPKDSAGNIFPLSQYVSPAGTTKFTIAPRRETLLEGETAISGYAQISNDQAYILCAITPANGELLVPGTEYVYDIEIARADANYDYVYTLLTGTISVTGQVTPSAPLEIPELPNNPTSLELEGLTSDSISISWTAPAAGGDVDEYKLYILEYTTDPATILGALSAPPADTIDGTETSYTFEGLDPETGYLVGVRSSNQFGNASLETILTSLLAGPITTLPEAS
jgi:hypothetical protein